MSDRRLLVLDDDAMVGRTVKSIAETVGFEARATQSPTEFFQFVEEWVPTHVAIDLVMPEMDGVEVIARLSTRRCRAQIIITSGMAGRVLEAAGRSASEHGLNILGVLPKPFLPNMLRELLGAEVPVRGAGGRPEIRTPRGPIEVAVITPDDITEALRDRAFQMAYQPKVTCVARELAGYEALVRWRHPRFGNVAPDRFIPLAEKHNLIDSLTEQVAEQSFAWFAENCSEPGSKLTLSINISARSLRNVQLLDAICERCKALAVDPARVIFELTETSAMEDPVASLDTLTRLRMRGFQLSLDDFGTGFSSMLQLVRLPFSEIKVDKSFVMAITRSAESRSVVRSIVDLGHSLGMHATAEGVEDAQVLAYLQEVGCDLAQGYYFARPMPGPEAARWRSPPASATA